MVFVCLVAPVVDYFYGEVGAFLFAVGNAIKYCTPDNVWYYDYQ